MRERNCRRPGCHRVKGFASRGLVRLILTHAVIIHLIDGTYELFRHFYGLRRFTKGKDRPYGAVVGVLQTVLQMMENGERSHVLSASPPTT